MTTIHLVRHAAHGFVDKVLVGRAPGIPLSADGVRQAERLRDHLAGWPIARIMSSPIQRAQETAAILAGQHRLAVETTDDLLEIDCGDWTGLGFDDLASDPRWAAWNSERASTTMPGGEDMAAVQRRAAPLLDQVAAADSGPVVLVSHSDVIKAMVAWLIGMSLDRHDRLVIDPASITTLEMWQPGAGRVVRMNEIAPS